MSTFDPIPAFELLPDVPFMVHGIKSIDPPMIQCDGCGVIYEGRGSLNRAIMSSGILFNPLTPGDGRRMCPECWAAES